VPMPDPGSGSRASGGNEHGLGLGLDCAGGLPVRAARPRARRGSWV